MAYGSHCFCSVPPSYPGGGSQKTLQLAALPFNWGLMYNGSHCCGVFSCSPKGVGGGGGAQLSLLAKYHPMSLTDSKRLQSVEWLQHMSCTPIVPGSNPMPRRFFSTSAGGQAAGLCHETMGTSRDYTGACELIFFGDTKG